MRLSSLPYAISLVALISTLGANAQTKQEWDAQSYPNPTADGYQRCNMRSTGAICDPDSVLSEQQRYRINYELSQLESRTRQPGGGDFCEKKGITAAVALAKHVRGASENAVKSMANDMLRKWTLDTQCQKSMVIVMATEDRKFWVARDPKVPVYGAEFTDLFNDQKPLFQQRNYQQALMNMIQGTWEKALAKQGPAEEPSEGGRQIPFTPSKPGKEEDRGRGGWPSSDGGFSMPGLWVWLLIVLVIVPLLCCCCCIYFCCCRKKGGGERRQGPMDHPDPEVGHRGGGGGGRGMGGGLSNFLGGMGGAAIGNQIGNWFSGGRGNRGNAPAGPPPPYGDPTPNAGRGGYEPGQPQPGGKGGRGLYPSAEVKDEGGGGGW